MKIPKLLRLSCAITLSLSLSHIPQSFASQMITTQELVSELSESDARADLESFLADDSVRIELEKRGLSTAEVSKRLATLSESELRQLRGELEQAKAGGDILITILVVVLIIYLIKRI